MNKMKALVFGSMNIDRVYSLAALPEKGETLTCEKYEIHVGGKGLNQAISLSKAGAEVYMAGIIGADGLFLKEYLEKCGVDTSMVKVTGGFTGHAVIEVEPEGQNQMILFPGANHEADEEFCDSVLEKLSAGDLILMQYETSQVEYMIKKAHEKGLKVAFNPSPFTGKLKSFDYSDIDYLILNESEGAGISGESDPLGAASALEKLTCGGTVILTLGGNGAICVRNGKITRAPAFEVDAVDTTGAGDTFTGYILTALLNGADEETALLTASAASAIAVTKPGAAETIPCRAEVSDFIERRK